MTTRTSPLAPWRDISDPREARDRTDLEGHLGDLTAEAGTSRAAVGPVQVTIDRHRVRRYLFSQDLEQDEAVVTDDDGHQHVTPMILANDLLQLYNVIYSASRVRGLHAQEELWLASPVMVGEVVTMSGQFVEAYERRGQVHVVLETEAHGADGRLLLRHRGVEMLSDNPGGLSGRGAGAPGTAGEAITGETEPGADVVGSGGVVAVGQVLESQPLTVTFEQAAVYSRYGEFVLNVHNDIGEARRQGLVFPIVQGQQQVAFLASFLEQTFGSAWTASGNIRVKFLRPVEVFEDVVLEGKVARVDTTATPRMHLELWVKDGAGNLRTVAWAAVDLPVTPDGARG